MRDEILAGKVNSESERSEVGPTPKIIDKSEIAVVEGLVEKMDQQNSILCQIKNMLVEDHGTEREIRRKAFDRLYDEMNQKKEQLEIIERTIKPILADLILLFDNLKNFQKKITEKPLTIELVSDELKFIIDNLLEVLYRQDVEPIETGSTGKYNRKFQKVLKVLQTEIEEEDNTVAEVVRSGFTWKENVLRLENIIVKQYNTD